MNDTPELQPSPSTAAPAESVAQPVVDSTPAAGRPWHAVFTERFLPWADAHPRTGGVLTGGALLGAGALFCSVVT